MADNFIANPGVGGDTFAADDVAGVKYPYSKLDIGADGVSSPVNAGNPMPVAGEFFQAVQPVSIAASDFVTSTVNSTTANIAAGATWVGAIESTVSQPSVSYLAVSDQPLTITISQYVDLAGVYAVNNIVRYVDAGAGYSESFPINGDYFRISVKNTGTAATTILNVNVGFGTIPSADKLGRTPVSMADAIPILTQTLSAAGASTTMDTTGYQSIVTQISGAWQGSGTFESSNDGTSWDTVLVLSRDNVSMLDIVTSGGLYTVKPSGRYLRFVVTSITGSLVLNSIGRASQGISGADMLSLAMDRQLNMPMFTELNDASLSRLAQANSMPVLTWSGQGVVPINTVLIGPTDISGYRGVLAQWNGAMATGTIVVQGSMDGANWQTLTGGSTGVTISSSISTSASSNITRFSSPGKFIRAIMSVASTSGVGGTFTLGLSQIDVNPGAVAINSIAGALAAGANVIGDVGIQYRANATGAAVNSRFMSAATTNGALILTGARRLLGWSLTNTTASAKFFKIYNKATAPTVGTDTPILTIGIAANSTENFNMEGGIAVSLGLGVGCTGAVADTDTTATAVNDVVGAIFYA